jgi:hypothetical protein
MRTLLATIALSLTLAGCGGDPGTKPVTEPADTPATSSAPVAVKVSDATICSRLVDATPAPLARAIDVMKKDYAPGDEDEAFEVADELEALAGRAENAQVGANLQVMADELRAIFSGTKEDTADFVVSATEVNQVCGNTARF